MSPADTTASGMQQHSVESVIRRFLHHQRDPSRAQYIFSLQALCRHRPTHVAEKIRKVIVWFATSWVDGDYRAIPGDIDLA